MKFTTFWNFHDMHKGSLWTYVSPVNQTLISTPVKEQTGFFCGQIQHIALISNQGTSAHLQGRCKHTIKSYDKHSSGQCWCTYKKARSYFPPNESQNGWGCKASLEVVLSIPSQFKQVRIQQVTQDHVQAVFEYLHGWRFHNQSGQPDPVLVHPEKSFF